MKHKMGLYAAPFRSVKSGRKKIEVRLNDEKRRKLKVGDTITFTKIPGETETLSVKVTDLRRFSTFREMYESIPAGALDATGETIDRMVENTYEIYSPEQEKRWGTLAIEVEILD